MLACTKSWFNEAIANSRNRMGKVEKELIKTEKVLERLSCNGESYFLEGAIQDCVKQLQADLDNLAEVIRLAEMAIEMLSDYSYTGDPQPQVGFFTSIQY